MSIISITMTFGLVSVILIAIMIVFKVDYSCDTCVYYHHYCCFSFWFISLTFYHKLSFLVGYQYLFVLVTMMAMSFIFRMLSFVSD